MKNLFFAIILLLSYSAFGQILEPVKWTTSVEKVSDTEYELISKATIDEGWHLYSQNVPEDGPIPTTFSYDNGKEFFELKGKTSEEEGHVINDPVFDMEIKFFEETATFKQLISLNKELESVEATVEFMVCDDTRCLPPTEVDLVFNLPIEINSELQDTTSGENVFTLSDNNSNISGILEPVKWEFGYEKISGDTYNLSFTANIDENWAIYSQHIDGDTPIPTTVIFQENKNYELIGETIESTENKIVKEEPLFDNVKVGKFYNKATFTQKVKVLEGNSFIEGDVQYITCDDEKCLFPPMAYFKFEFKADEVNIITERTFATTVQEGGSVNTALYGMAPDDVSLSGSSCDSAEMVKDSGISESKGSLWSIFGLGFLGGLLALLTPCVFPMIPLTVSFFTKKGGESKGSGISKALLYGFFIFAVYILLSVPFHLLDSVNPDILNEISTNVWLNVIFFAIFMFFAFSFFGYYELTLPASWTTKTTKGENAGGLIGIFFMALTLAIVSFSCTGPILGSLLAGSLTADGGAWQLTAGMAGFGVSLGLPFALFAMFPNMMNALPKSGGWLNTTKVILGFLELALAFKFLSNADLVAHWDILKIEPFLIIWILIFGGLALYLFGKIKFPHDSPIKKLSFSRISGGILVLAFTVYLISGFRVNKETNTFTSLTLLSGLAPPVGYSFLYPSECPNNLECFKDLKTGIAHAKKVNKPIMLDFTGYACVNCRKMEEHVWSEDKIDDVLRNDYVLISLYVDDKKELPEEQQVLVKRINGGTRKLENYGHKWANYQTQFFKTNSQPFYVLLNSDGNQVLNSPVGYMPDADDYLSFLECGLEIFENGHGKTVLASSNK